MDLLLTVPWVNRRRPFVAFHVAPFPSYRIRNGRAHKTYHCGLMWGRQFMPTPTGGAWWFDIEIPRWNGH